MNEPEDDTLRDWLLHRLPDEQAAALEERLLQDDAFGARLCAVETDLLDDYARQLLSADERMAVARWLLATPQDRLRLDTARALASAMGPVKLERAHIASLRQRRLASASELGLPSVRAHARRRSAALAWMTAAAALVALFIYRQRSDAPKPAASFAANAQTITLLASLQRGATEAPSASVRIPPAAPVRLQVEIAAPGVSTRYTLRIGAATRNVFDAQGLVVRANGPYRFIEVALAPNLLVDGDYRISVAVDGAVQPLQQWALRTRSE